MLNEAVTVDKWTAPRQVDNWKNINFSGMWKNSIEFFRISLFVPVVYKWLKSCAKKAHFPYPIEILFLNLCGSSVSHLFFWYLYRLWPIAMGKTSSLTEWIPLRTILLYQRSFFIIPKVPSASLHLHYRDFFATMGSADFSQFVVTRLMKPLWDLHA